MLTLEQAAFVYRDECVLILEEILAGNQPVLYNGLCRLITERTGREKIIAFGDNNEGSLGYVISSLTMSRQDFNGYFGNSHGWSAKRLGWLCGVVAMSPEAWVERVKQGAATQR